MKGSRKLYIKSFGCQMNVYDFAAYGGHPGAGRLCRDRNARGRRSRHPQHLPHPREGGGEGLFRARPHAPLEGGRRRRGPQCYDRGGRLRRAGRRRGDHPPRAGRRSRRRIAELSPPAGPARARRARLARSSIPSSRSRTSSTRWRRRARRQRAGAASPPSSRCRKAATSSAPSASFPIRAAPRFRARSRKIVAEVERLADAGVREITLIGQNVNAYHGEGAGRAKLAAGAAASPASPSSRASSGCVTPRAIRST